MANPFFAALGGQPNLAQMLQSLRANPMQMLLQNRLNVPAAMTNDPNAILNHLVSSGQISQEQVNRAYQTAQKMGIK